MDLKAQVTTINLAGLPDTHCVWCNSSEPPMADGDDVLKPTWKHSSSFADATPGERPIDGSNNIWYKLKDRIGSMRIGGFGDQYIGFLRFPVPGTTVPFKKVTLRLFLESEGVALPKEIEVRAVTSADPLPIEKKNMEVSWVPEKIRFAAQPSSRFLTHVPVKAGWVEIDLTEWVKGETRHGLRFSDTDGPGERFVRIHGPASKNPPQLVVEK